MAFPRRNPLGCLSLATWPSSRATLSPHGLSRDWISSACMYTGDDTTSPLLARQEHSLLSATAERRWLAGPSCCPCLAPGLLSRPGLGLLCGRAPGRHGQPLLVMATLSLRTAAPALPGRARRGGRRSCSRECSGRSGPLQGRLPSSSFLLLPLSLFSFSPTVPTAARLHLQCELMRAPSLLACTC